ncbi:hypothetical protein BVY02_00425 [bacterium J17]|nr:hypothetical protein BVY02_00425 [bacterium J17]
MQRVLPPSDENVEDPSVEVGKNFLLPDEQSVNLWDSQALATFPNLLQLKSTLQSFDESSSSSLRHASSPLSIEQLEMLEAELSNQGILPKLTENSCSLVQCAVHDSSVWRWRAQRFTVDTPKIDFLVNVPLYTLWRAQELSQILLIDVPGKSENPAKVLKSHSNNWRLRTEDRNALILELEYLESFAGYLIGQFDEVSNRFQKGLNLILKVLSSSSLPLSVGSIKKEKNILIVSLPTERHEFFETLKKFCSRDL